MSAPIDISRLNIVVGHATDESGATGVTVVRGLDAPLRAGVALFGRASGTRELATATPEHLVGGRIDAILLTGGSAYGLDAAAGVMDWMEEKGRGFSVGAGVVPIVPAAVVFDLTPLGAFDARPTPVMAFNACDLASTLVREGAIGAGTGVTVGKILGASRCMKSGLGVAIVDASGAKLSVGAIAVVNAFGDVRDASGAIIAGARDDSGDFVDTARILRGASTPSSFEDTAMQNTTLVVVACSAPLTAVELSQVAGAAGAGLYRRITPVATSFDGDVVFAVSPLGGERVATELLTIETLAAAAVEQAIERAVRAAYGRDGIPGLADTHGN